MADELDDLEDPPSDPRRRDEARRPPMINDPVALKTGWTAAGRGGANFRTHRLVETAPERFEYRATLHTRLFALLLAGGGLAGVVLGPIYTPPASSPVVAFVFGLLFLLVGAYLYVSETTPIVFDGRRRTFWIGRRDPDRAGPRSTPRPFARFDQIHALQLVPHSNGGGRRGGYRSFELNVVLEDGSRIRLLDHPDGLALDLETETLSALVGVPTWSALDLP